MSRIAADLQIAAYERALISHASGVLLDLGCGNAPLAGIYGVLVERYEWADWLNSPHQLFELDHDLDLNQQPLPLESDAYDTVLLSDVLEHVAEPHALMREIHRILRPGGCVIIGVPFLYPIHEQPHDHYRYTRYQLDYLARRNCFWVFSIEEIGGIGDVIADLSAKLLGAVWPPLARVPYHTWSMLRSFAPLRVLNARSAARAPLAYIALLQKPQPASQA